MKFDDLDKQLRLFETAYDNCIPANQYIVVRLDGKGFTRLTKEIWQFEAPFDIRFKDIMVNTTEHLMNCGFNICYGYTQSDEISLLFDLNEQSYNRKIRKIISILAAEASAKFSLLQQQLAVFDARVCILPDTKTVEDYFRWRQEDANRNALNAHCYWMLRKEGYSVKLATAQVKDLNRQAKYELLSARGIEFDQLSQWQRGGIGLYWGTFEKIGFNPKSNQATRSIKRRIIIADELPTGDEYSQLIQNQLHPKTP